MSAFPSQRTPLSCPTQHTAHSDLGPMPVGGLDSLKNLLQQKKAEKKELVGDKKYVRKSELEEARLKRIREEEEAERRAKVGLVLLTPSLLPTAAATEIQSNSPVTAVEPINTLTDIV